MTCSNTGAGKGHVSVGTAGDGGGIRLSFPLLKFKKHPTPPDALEAFEGQEVTFPKMLMWAQKTRSDLFPGALILAPTLVGHAWPHALRWRKETLGPSAKPLGVAVTARPSSKLHHPVSKEDSPPRCWNPPKEAHSLCPLLGGQAHRPWVAGTISAAAVGQAARPEAAETQG